MVRLTLHVLTVIVAIGWLTAVFGPWGTATPPTDFAAARGGDADGMFDGDRAMKYLKAVCDIGPRISASDGMKKQQEMLQKHFEAHGAKVTLQRFKAKQRSQKQAVEMANMIASWQPDRVRRLIICSHYDTRPIADQEPERRNWTKPFVSANDGGSGVAFLMEMAHQMKDLKTQVGVDFVLFDGEEYIFQPGEGNDKYFLGSEHFAETYRKEKPKHSYLGAVLLDMIASKKPSFPIERNSRFLAGALQQQIWKIAAEQKCAAFKDDLGLEVQDDHLPLNKIAKIPAIDIIDFDYEHWHRLSDTPDNCSSDGMIQVARVLTVWLQRAR